MANQLPLAIDEQIQHGISILIKGGLVAFPTDTLYGLGVCSDNYDAVKRVYQVKNRPFYMGLPLLVAEKSQIKEVVKYVSQTAEILIDRFLPGGLTLVMPKANSVNNIVTGGGDTVAVRIPDHPVPISLIKGTGKPIVGTSANLSGKPSTLTAKEVYLQLGGKIELIINGGKCEGGRGSTIIDVSKPIPILIREGIISRMEIETVCQIV